MTKTVSLKAHIVKFSHKCSWLKVKSENWLLIATVTNFFVNLIIMVTKWFRLYLLKFIWWNFWINAVNERLKMKLKK